MKIELCNDNGFLFNNGVPTLVVLVVNGKTRIPYEATKTIQELYQDVQKLNDSKEPSQYEKDCYVDPTKETPAQTFWKQAEQKFSHVIEREDIIKCTNLMKDIDGNVNENVEIGKEYRVIDIHKQNGKLTYYDILDDSADTKHRIQILPSEIELVRKHVKQPPRSVVPQMTVKCLSCNEVNVVFKIDGVYQGKCEKCGMEIGKEMSLAAVD